MRIFVKAASHRWRGKVLIKILMEKDYYLGTTEMISEFRNSDFLRNKTDTSPALRFGKIIVAEALISTVGYLPESRRIKKQIPCP